MLAMPAPKQKKPAAPVLTKTMKPMRQIQNHLLTKMPPLLLMNIYNYLKKCRSRKVWKLAFKLAKR